MIQDNNKPAPSNRHQVVRHLGKSFVLDPFGNTAWGPGAHDLAHRKCDALNAADDKRLKRGPRACMCCGATFASEGIHNRMCNGCRGKSDYLGDMAFAGPTDGRKPRKAARV